MCLGENGYHNSMNKSVSVGSRLLRVGIRNLGNVSFGSQFICSAISCIRSDSGSSSCRIRRCMRPVFSSSLATSTNYRNIVTSWACVNVFKVCTIRLSRILSVRSIRQHSEFSLPKSSIHMLSVPDTICHTRRCHLAICLGGNG